MAQAISTNDSMDMIAENKAQKTAETPKKKGNVPPGLAAYLAKKKGSTTPPSGATKAPPPGSGDQGKK